MFDNWDYANYYRHIVNTALYSKIHKWAHTEKNKGKCAFMHLMQLKVSFAGVFLLHEQLLSLGVCGAQSTCSRTYLFS